MLGRVLAALTLVAFLVGAASIVAPPAQAQEARPAPEAGDQLWAFANEPPMFDERVRLAFLLLVDEQAAAQAAGLWPDTQLFYADAPLRETAEATPPGDAELLMAAAGYPSGALLEIEPCRVWTAPDVPAEAAAALAAEVAAAVGRTGSDAQPCVAADGAAEAHLLIWPAGAAAPSIPSREQATWLGSPEPAGPGIPPGQGGEGLPPITPPQGGSAGLLAAEESERDPWLGVLALLAAASVAAAAVVVRHTSRRA